MNKQVNDHSPTSVLGRTKNASWLTRTYVKLTVKLRTKAVPSTRAQHTLQLSPCLYPRNPQQRENCHAAQEKKKKNRPPLRPPHLLPPSKTIIYKTRALPAAQDKGSKDRAWWVGGWEAGLFWAPFATDPAPNCHKTAVGEPLIWWVRVCLITRETLSARYDKYARWALLDWACDDPPGAWKPQH